MLVYYPKEKVCEISTIAIIQSFCLELNETLTLYLSFYVQESDSAMRNPSFPLRSPQSGCSPAGSDGTPKREYMRRESRSLIDNIPIRVLYSHHPKSLF